MFYQAKGRQSSILEDVSDPLMASKDKDLTQRLESTVIHWTRQIKEVVNSSDMFVPRSGPGRWMRLSSGKIEPSISQALATSSSVQEWRASLKCSITQSPRTSALFDSLNLIQQNTAEAMDNLKFLSILRDCCLELAGSRPVELPQLLPKLLSRIRGVWVLSRYYNTEERLTTLLRKVSNEVISRCCATIDLELVFHGNVFTAMESLHQSIDSGVQWRKIYQKAVQSIKESVSDKRRH